MNILYAISMIFVALLSTWLISKRSSRIAKSTYLGAVVGLTSVITQLVRIMTGRRLIAMPINPYQICTLINLLWCISVCSMVIRDLPATLESYQSLRRTCIGILVFSCVGFLGIFGHEVWNVRTRTAPGTALGTAPGTVPEPENCPICEEEYDEDEHQKTFDAHEPRHTWCKTCSTKLTTCPFCRKPLAQSASNEIDREIQSSLLAQDITITMRESGYSNSQIRGSLRVQGFSEGVIINVLGPE